MRTAQKAAERFKLPPKEVRHSDLKRYGDSQYKSIAPCCGGLLLLRRDANSWQLSREDVCVRCGRRYRYTDTAVNSEPFHDETPETS